MKNARYLLGILFLTIFVFTSSCTKDFEEINTNPKAITTPTSGGLFAAAVKSSFDRYNTVSGFNNVAPIVAQYFAQVTYTQVSQHEIQNDIGGNMWSRYYFVLGNFKHAADANNSSSSSKEVKDNRTACLEIMNVWTYALLTDLFGGIPYTEALKGGEIKAPRYDTQKFVYDALFARLSKAIGLIKTSKSGFKKGDDLIYGGDMDKWKKFANTLMLRMAVRVQGKKSDFKNYPDVNTAIAGMFKSSSDNAELAYAKTPPSNHPLYDVFVLSNRFDYMVANTVIDLLKSKDDPRISFIADLPRDGSGKYFGAPYGAGSIVTAGQKKYSTIKGYITTPKTGYHVPDLKGKLMTYAEACFLKAEIKKDKNAYIEGVKASMQSFGVSDEDTKKYTDKMTGTPYSLEDVITQKYISMYPTCALEAWTEWRRTGFPTLNQPAGAPKAISIERYIYPVAEGNLNKANLDKAIEGLSNAKDDYNSRVWWDTKSNTLKKQ